MRYLSKKEFVYEQIKNDIDSGVLLPNQKLVPSSLATNYGMSQMPIREALQQLYAEGYVQKAPYIGTTVADFDINQIFETTAIRFSAEFICFDSTIRLMQKSKIEELRSIVDESKKLYEQGNINDYLTKNRSFHLSLYVDSPYATICDISRKLFSYCRIATSKLAPHTIPIAIDNHYQVLNLIETKKFDEATQTYIAHKKFALTSVLNVMAEYVNNPCENSPVARFYINKDLVNDKENLLNQIELLKKLFI